MYSVSLLRELKLGYGSLVLRINTSQIDITKFSVTLPWFASQVFALVLRPVDFRDAHGNDLGRVAQFG